MEKEEKWTSLSN